MYDCVLVGSEATNVYTPPLFRNRKVLRYKMGLYDRDYMKREEPEKNQKSEWKNTPYAKEAYRTPHRKPEKKEYAQFSEKSSVFKNIVLSLSLLVSLLIIMDVAFWKSANSQQTKNPNVTPEVMNLAPALPEKPVLSNNQAPVDSTPKVESQGILSTQPVMNLMPRGVSIQADSKGHYRGVVLINNIAMPFMIDTGATHTVIPTKMSYAARLPLGEAFQTNTANGLAVNRLTRINSLKIGNAEIRNLEAATTDHLEEVLIGMNTLRLFRMTQDRNILTLVAYPDEVSKMESTAPVTPEHPAKKWTKTVQCDEHKVCKTSYR
jgi:aspartyl protease family protein